MRSIDAEKLVDCANTLGESAFWSAASRVLYWVDGSAGEIHSWREADAHHEIRSTGEALGMIAPTTDPALVIASDSRGVALLNLSTRSRQSIADPEQGREGIGYNDGKVDPTGRLWVGTYDSSELEPRGTLWHCDNGGHPVLADSGMAVVNGPAFSPSAEVMYVSDSIGRRILAFDLHEGKLSRRRVFVQCTPDEGLPDGLTVDADGGVWCAHWDGYRVTRFSPSGERDTVIRLTVPRVTSVAFGGADLTTLFITTARYGLTEEQLRQSPLAGALFHAAPGACGVLPTPLELPFRCGQ